MNKIRIVHVITRLDLGGSADCTALTMLGTAKFLPSLLITGESQEESRYAQVLRAQGVDILIVPELVRAVDPLSDLRALSSLRKLLRELRPELVHTHTSKAGVLGRMAATLEKVPRIVHTPHGHVFTGYFSPALARGFIAAERMLAPLTDKIICLTPSGIEQHLERGIGRPDQYCAIHSGVELAHYSPGSAAERRQRRQILGYRDADIVVGWVGRLEQVKNPLLIVDSLARARELLPSLKLLMAGNGPLCAAVLAGVKSSGLQEVVRLIEHQNDVSDLYPAMDIYALTSLNEGMGRVLIEAMNHGLPIVGTAVGGVPSVVEDGKQGFLAQAGDAAAMAAYLLRLARDNDLRIAMGKAARKKAGDYSVEAMVEQHLALYGELLECLSN